jgi:hypothetical protein
MMDMGTGGQIMRSIAFACVLFIATPAAAEMLLLEIGWENQPQQLPAAYTFSVSNPGGGDSWKEMVTSYPHHSFAPQATVDILNVQLGWRDWDVIGRHFPFIELAILQGMNEGSPVLQGPHRPALCQTCYFDTLVANVERNGRTGAEWRAFNESVGWNVDLRVPLLGPGLQGYEVTRIERSVTPEAQTIRLYGFVVPEPASWLLVAVGLCCFGHRCGRGQSAASRIATAAAGSSSNARVNIGLT